MRVASARVRTSRFRRRIAGTGALSLLFLASAEASYITGSVLPVGGGDQG